MGDRAAHVGHHLIGKGRRDLETDVAYRPRLRFRVRRFAYAHATALYLGSIVGLTTLVAGLGVAYARSSGGSLAMQVGVALLLLVPASDFAIACVQRLAASLAPPRRLPRLDLAAAVPADSAHPGRGADAAVERRRGRGVGGAPRGARARQPRSSYPLRPADRLPGRTGAGATRGRRDRSPPRGRGSRRSTPRRRARRSGVATASSSSTASGSGTRARAPGWAGSASAASSRSSTACCAGRPTPASACVVGDPAVLPGVRYCITLDSDTRLPRDAAKALIGIIAHPLNRPRRRPEAGPRHRGLRHPAAAGQRHHGERRRLALRPPLRRPHRRRPLHDRGLGHLSGPLRRGDLHRQGALRRRCLHRRARRARARERAALARPVRGPLRPHRAGHRRRAGGRLPGERAGPRPAPAPLGARRLADPALAVPLGAQPSGRARAQPSPAHRALEDPRQPAPQPGGAGDDGAACCSPGRCLPGARAGVDGRGSRRCSPSRSIRCSSRPSTAPSGSCPGASSCARPATSWRRCWHASGCRSSSWPTKRGRWCTPSP